jgi:hypothetical protein
MKYDYNGLVEQLRNSVLTVTFEKVDGTERVMRCTLLPQYLPEEFKSKAPMLTETTPTTISVWDLEASGWRSFRVDNVRSVL